MTRMNSFCCIAGVALIWLTASIFPAQAAEAYLCDDGRLLHVEPEDLERMKRTEPCIAAYYEGQRTKKQSVRLGSKQRLSLRTKRAVRSTPAGRSTPIVRTAPVATMNLKRLRDEPRASGPVRKAEVKVGLEKTNEAPPVQVDYRNIPVINATSDSPGWYYHSQ